MNKAIEKEIKKLIKKYPIACSGCTVETFKDVVPWATLSCYWEISNDFIDYFKDHISWQDILFNRTFDEQFLEKFVDCLNWTFVCFQDLSDEFIERHKDRINWSTFCKFNSPTFEFIEKYIDRVDWDCISRFHNNLTEAFIEKHQDKVDWSNISINVYTLSEAFIEKHQDKVDWRCISMKQSLSEAFIEKHQDKVDWTMVTQCQDVSEEFLARFMGEDEEETEDLKEVETMDNEIIKSIKLMAVNGNRLELPDPKKVTISNYPQLKATLTKAGGKYKKNGFEFKEPADQIKARLIGGEKIDDKKTFQFFPTPKSIVSQLLDRVDLKASDSWLEPQAGQGAISNEMRTISINGTVVELMPQNIKELEKQGYKPVEGDFLAMSPDDLGTFDKIIANPPFTRNQDIDHIMHMFKFLKSGGTMASVASTAWKHGSQTKQQLFKDWLDCVGATIEYVPAGAFKESGTQIATTVITITK